MTHAEHICRSKKAWSTRVKAQVHALGVMNHPVPAYRSGCPIHVYQCPVCGLYHLTKISPAEWAARQAAEASFTSHFSLGTSHSSPISPASAGTGTAASAGRTQTQHHTGHG